MPDTLGAAILAARTSTAPGLVFSRSQDLGDPLDGDLRVTETDVKYFIGDLEIVFVGIPFGPLMKLHIAPPVFSSAH